MDANRNINDLTYQINGADSELFYLKATGIKVDGLVKSRKINLLPQYIGYDKS